MQQPSQESKEFMTFDKYRSIPGNKDKSFSDYLLQYFNERAKPYVLRAIPAEINSKVDYGMFSRITNDVSTIHPRLSYSTIRDHYATAINQMEEDEQYKDATFKRWFFASVYIISQLFLDQNGKIKDQFLETLVGSKVPEKVGDQLQQRELTSLRDVKAKIYGEPEDPETIMKVATQVLGGAGIALSMILMGDQRFTQPGKYRDKAFIRSPDDPLRMPDLQQIMEYKEVRNFFRNDYFLSRLEMFRIQNSFLIQLNELLPPGHKVEGLKTELNELLDNVIIHSPIAGTQEYNQLFNFYLTTQAKKINELTARNPDLKPIFDQYEKLWNDCYGSLSDPEERVMSLLMLQTSLDDLMNQTERNVLPARRQASP